MQDITANLIAQLKSSQSHNSRVLIAGDLNFDIIDLLPRLPEEDEEIFITNRSMTLAGSAGIFTHAIGKLGGEAYFAGKVGDDEGGASLCTQLGRVGVNTEGVIRVPGGMTAETHIYVDETAPGRRLMITLRGAFDDLDLRELDLAIYRDKADVLHLCSYFVLPKLQPEMPRIIRQAKALGFKVSFDANSGDGWNHPQTLDVFRHEIFPFVDYLFLNRYEATSVTGQSLPPSHPCGRGAGGEGGWDAMLDALAEWNSDGILTIKLDAEGSCSRCDGRTIYVDGFPCAQIQDTVGAGDTFDATFVHYHQKGFSIDTAAVLANANARATLEKAGGPTGQCTEADLMDLLGGYQIACIAQSDSVVRYGIQVRD